VNTRIRPAVRWRAGVTSLQMWAQMAMRILVIAVALWATSAVALVWYWVGTMEVGLLTSSSAAGYSRGFSPRFFPSRSYRSHLVADVIPQGACTSF